MFLRIGPLPRFEVQQGCIGSENETLQNLETWELFIKQQKWASFLMTEVSHHLAVQGKIPQRSENENVKIHRVVCTRAVTALGLMTSIQWFKGNAGEAKVPQGSVNSRTPFALYLSDWRTSHPTGSPSDSLEQDIEVEARIAIGGVEVGIYVPSLVVATGFHGDCSG